MPTYDLGKVVGDKGENGTSAYESAVAGGYTGTLAEFEADLANLPLMVPNTRMINLKPLTGDIFLSWADVYAPPHNHASERDEYGGASESEYGHVKLSPSVHSPSTTHAATSSAVKRAFEIAEEASMDATTAYYFAERAQSDATAAYDLASLADTSAHDADTKAGHARTVADNAEMKADDAYYLAERAQSDANDAYSLAEQKAEKSVLLSGVAYAYDWAGSSPPFYNEVSVLGITQDANAIVSVESDCTAEQMEATVAAILHPYRAQRSDFLTLRAFGEKPEIDIPISVLIVG